MKSHLIIANSLTMAILCAGAILLVLAQALLMMRMAWKKGNQLEIPEITMKKCIKSSAFFSIIPSLPIIISYLLLIPALGRFFPWLRLSVVGSAVYETMVSDMAAKSLGFSSIFTSDFPPDIFICIMFVASAAILGGIFFNVLFLKRVDDKVRKIKSSNSKAAPILTTAVFLGLYGTFSAPYLVDILQPITIITLLVSGAAAVWLQKLSGKIAILKDFSFSLSIIVGMTASCILSWALKQGGVV